jgi:uncharacterized tellurite resistance protein B-like protein
MLWVFFLLVIIVVIAASSSSRKGRRKASQRSSSGRIHATVTVETGPSVSTGAGGHATLKWVGAGEPIKVGPYQIEDAFTYVSNGTPAQEEASCINLRLSVGTLVTEEPSALGYWPQYSRLSPDQRANYLVWLASGKKNELADIGYAFIYFYGLERRALLDDQDVEKVLAQVNRLMLIYSASRSFFGYSSRFIAYLFARKGLESVPRELFDALFEQSLKEFDDETLAVALGWLCKASAPLPPFLAFEVARNDIRASRSVVVTRVAEQFRKVFFKKYTGRFGGGMQLEAAARDRLIEYRPGSPTLLHGMAQYSLPRVHIPNVLGLPSQFKPLVDIWGECIEELKPLSREVGKGRDVVTREGYRALPDALKAEVDHPDKDKWEKFVAANTNERSIVITTVGDLAPLCGFDRRPKLTSRESEELASTASDVGFVLVPDPRVTGRGYKWDEMVALFQSEGRSDVPWDNKYRAAVLMLEMGMAVAAADGTIEQVEVDQIVSFLKGQFLLAPNDVRRIEAYREILVKQPPVLAHLAKRLQSALTVERLELVCQFLVGIAAANGSIDRGERTTLRRFYTAMGLPISKLDEIIAKLTGPASDTVEVQGGVAVAGERIPARPEQPVFKLNEAALQTILQETEEVAQMLGDALAVSSEEEAEDIVTEAQRLRAGPSGAWSDEESESSGTAQIYNGLDPRYQSVVAELLSRAIWTVEDFGALARKHNVMPAGMLEAINTWSDENYGDFLIEGSERYTVNRSLLEKT